MKRVSALLLKVALSGGLLALLLSRIDLRHLWGLWASASLGWLVAAFGLYLFQLLVGAWRWGLLLRAQDVAIGTPRLLSSCFVALFFNNFLPSTVGGDVIRIADTAPHAGSKTLATTVVLMDRVLGLLGLVFVGAVAAGLVPSGSIVLPAPIRWLWACLLAGALVLVAVLSRPGLLRRAAVPLRLLGREWVEVRVDRLVDALTRFRQRPWALAGGFAGAVAIHAVLVGAYVAIVRSMGIPIPALHLAVLVPMSFIIQAVPISVNGLGVREATFSLYFARIGLPLESALAVSFMSAALAALASLGGAAVYVLRRPTRTAL